MKRSLWFDVSMLALILIAALVGAKLDRESNVREAAVGQSATSHR